MSIEERVNSLSTICPQIVETFINMNLTNEHSQHMFALRDNTPFEGKSCLPYS